MKAFKSVIISVVTLFCFSAASNGQHTTDPVIGLHENKPNVIALTNAKIITAPGVIREKATLLIRKDRIEAVGSNVALPPDAIIRDLSGKTIYPGFIDLFTNYGMPEPAKSNSSRQANASLKEESAGGAVHWNAAVKSENRAVELIRHDKKTADSLRRCGFTTVLTFPPQGIFRGSGALVLLNDKKSNQTILMEDVAQVMSFSAGVLTQARGVDAYPASIMGAIALIRQTLMDAAWYKQAMLNFQSAPSGQSVPEANLSLVSLQPYTEGQKPVIMATSDELEVLRAAKIADESGLNMWIMGSGYEYRRLQAVKQTGLKIIVPLNFPKDPDVSTREKELNVTLRELKHWDAAPENPGRLAKANIDIALTMALLEKKDDFISKIRTAVKRGLPPEKALQALTENPARWLDMSHLLGSLEKGKLANFIIADGNLFDDETTILETWIGGERYEITDLPEIDVLGSWALTINTNAKIDTGAMVITGKPLKMKATIHLRSKTTNVTQVSREERLLMMSFAGDSIGKKGQARMTGIVEKKFISGQGTWGDGSRFTWQAEFKKPVEEKSDTTRPKPVKMTEFEVVYPDGAFGRTMPPNRLDALLIKNATIWTCGDKGIVENGDLFIKNGKITRIDRNLSTPSNAAVIDASGKHVTPGIIDAHSHLAISGSGNEGTHAITSEVRIKDVIDSDDINIYRQLAGGVTTVCTLHGSANPIGGTFAVIKLRWGGLPEEMIVHGTREGLKMALGENVKQANWSDNPNPRYPQTRIGVVEIIRDAFQAAKDYKQEWEIYNQQSKNNKNLIPPRKILRYEALLDVLEGRTIIHCHAYRQDEIIALIRLAEEMGFKMDVFIHVLEGYKVAEELKKHGAMATTFSDWWAYKIEAYDAIPYNGAVLHDQDVVVSYNSDSFELARRLNTEASKAVKWGGVAPEKALKFVTLNAARQLHIDHRVGSLTEGKDADFVIWSGSPLSTYSVCEQTWIDGRKYFDVEEDKNLREKVANERVKLVQKILSKVNDKKGNAK